MPAPVGQDRYRRCTIRRHLTLPAGLWQRLAADAAAAGVSVSCHVAERLAAAAGSTVARKAATTSGREAAAGGLKHRCTVRLEGDVWDALSAEASLRGVPVAAVAREWLRRSVDREEAVPSRRRSEAVTSAVAERGTQRSGDEAREGSVLLRF